MISQWLFKLLLNWGAAIYCLRPVTRLKNPEEQTNDDSTSKLQKSEVNHSIIFFNLSEKKKRKSDYNFNDADDNEEGNPLNRQSSKMLGFSRGLGAGETQREITPRLGDGFICSQSTLSVELIALR